MANTYTKIHLQFVFAVKYREGIISRTWENELYRYITGIVQQQGHKMLAINGMQDHIHIVTGMRPVQSISDLLQDIKGGSSKWINENGLTRKRFEWQEGYGAFSYGAAQLPRLIRYVGQQKEHHLKMTFRKEYLSFLEKFEVKYDERYIFRDLI